jgi:Na+/proline symporter
MRYISSKDHTLAQKYSLGVAIRKYWFHPIHSFYTNPFSSFVKVAIIWLLSIVSIGAGLYLDISTTIEAGVECMWSWMLAAVSVPTLFGLTVHRMGHKRLARLNSAATIVSFFLVTLCWQIYR